MVHSKLKTKQFPKFRTVLDKIVSFLPRFDLNIVLFDKEDYEDIEKMSKIEVNVYLCNSDQIRQVGEKCERQVLNFTSPKMRRQMLEDRRIEEKKTPMKRGISLGDNRTRSARAGFFRANTALSSSSRFRPETSNSFKMGCLPQNESAESCFNATSTDYFSENPDKLKS